MLESFLQAQKVSVRKMLQRSFRKYITFGEETNHLIMHQLQGLVLNEEKYQKVSLYRFLCMRLLLCVLLVISHHTST